MLISLYITKSRSFSVCFTFLYKCQIVFKSGCAPTSVLGFHCSTSSVIFDTVFLIFAYLVGVCIVVVSCGLNSLDY